MALNPKQALFVKEYLVDKNATRAAKSAGYSAKTAGSQGHDLLKNPEIAAEIEKGVNAQLERSRKRAAAKELTKERWLEEVRAIALANMDDYATVEEFEVKNGTRGKKSRIQGVKAVLTKDRSRFKGRAIKKLSETKNGIGIELHSKQAALDTLGKHYGWVREQLDLRTPDGGVQVILTMPSNGREAPREPEQKPEPTAESVKTRKSD